MGAEAGARAPRDGRDERDEPDEREEAVRTVLERIQGAGPADSPGLDRLIHERVRLGIVSALAVNDSLTFNDLKGLLDVTDGNLSAHARKLEDAGYIHTRKGYDGRIPRTDYRITTAGREALEGYLGHMDALIRAVRE